MDVPGLEVAGTVAALGAGVSGLEVGEPIAAYLPAFGGYSEVVTADTRFVRSLHTGAGEADLAEAAGLPCVFPTAFGVLKDAGRLREGFLTAVGFVIESQRFSTSINGRGVVVGGR